MRASQKQRQLRPLRQFHFRPQIGRLTQVEAKALWGLSRMLTLASFQGFWMRAGCVLEAWKGKAWEAVDLSLVTAPWHSSDRTANYAL